MRQSLNLMVAASLLGGALTFAGCSEAPKPEPLSATPAPVAMATPAEAPKPAGDLGAARKSLENAAIELKAKNYAGATSAVALGGMMKGAAEKAGSAAGVVKDAAAEKAGAMTPKKQ